MENSTETVRFRTSVGGFNRTDVARYLEQLAKEARQEKWAQEEQLAALRKQAEEEKAGLQDEISRLQEENRTLREEKQALEAELARLTAGEPESAAEEEPEPVPEETGVSGPAEEEPEEEPAEELSEELPAEQTPETEPPVPAVSPDLQTQELAAYRRAEAAERLARARASALTGQVAAIQRAALDRFDDLNGEAGALYEEVSGTMNRLRETLADLHVLFQETETSLRALELPEADPDL